MVPYQGGPLMAPPNHVDKSDSGNPFAVSCFLHMINFVCVCQPFTHMLTLRVCLGVHMVFRLRIRRYRILVLRLVVNSKYSQKQEQTSGTNSVCHLIFFLIIHIRQQGSSNTNGYHSQEAGSVATTLVDKFPNRSFNISFLSFLIGMRPDECIQGLKHAERHDSGTQTSMDMRDASLAAENIKVDKCDGKPCNGTRQPQHLKRTMDLEPKAIGAMAKELGHDDTRWKEPSPSNQHESSMSPGCLFEITARGGNDGRWNRCFQASISHAIYATKGSVWKRVFDAINGNDSGIGAVGWSHHSGEHTRMKAII
mmetsp:Transcript_20319/g.42530  ORF Transcript_20319/g.42530 Transcript_20319/m.42530 type:complete len:310 (-) Transcript_20319:826-1755(-)